MSDQTIQTPLTLHIENSFADWKKNILQRAGLLFPIPHLNSVFKVGITMLILRHDVTEGDAIPATTS